MANQVLYGFYDLADLMAQRVTQVNTAVLSDAIDRSLAEHNRQIAALLNLFCRRTTDYSLNFKTMGARRLQPLDENGRARPTKSGALYEVAWPLQSGGDAFGQNFKARAKMTVREVNDELANMMIGDATWLRDHILAALFTNTDVTWLDELYGTLTVKPLANGDAVTYLRTGSTTAATDDHYLGQSGAISDNADPYPTIHTELMEHPENDGPYIALIAPGLTSATEGLTAFYTKPMPELSLGTNQQLIADLNVAVPGVVKGWHSSGVWIAEWDALPAGYIIGVAAGGEKPLAMREEPEPELQGFKRVAERDDHPWYESQYLRSAGFGAWNRVGALAMEIADASYDIPSGYTAPIP